MKIVIDIPEDVKKAFDDTTIDDLYGRYYAVGKAIKNGTPLLKGHGRLIDADKFVSEHFGKVARLVNDAPTIIEADKEGAEE